MLGSIKARTGRPVTTTALAVHLDMYQRTARLHLAKLERKGYVRRVGQRSGWLPAASALGG
jgi:predicted ArsR family transcriptional regulator